MNNIFTAINGLPDNPVCVKVNTHPEAANEVVEEEFTNDDIIKAFFDIVDKKPNLTIIK